MSGLGVSLPKRRLIYMRDLLHELVARDMKLRYKRSVLGVAWTLLNPLSQLVVLHIIFKLVLPLDVPNYTSFLFIGLLVWSWFQLSLHQATSAIVDNRELIRRPGFAIPILPAVTVASHLVHFLLALPILGLFLILGGSRLTSAVLGLPLLIILQFLLTLSLAYLVAILQVTFRDTQYLLSLLLQLLFYLTPIFYAAEVIPARYQPLYRLNPMVHLIEAYRAILMRGEIPDHLSSLGVLGLLAAGLLAFGFWTFTRVSYRFVEEL